VGVGKIQLCSRLDCGSAEQDDKNPLSFEVTGWENNAESERKEKNPMKMKKTHIYLP